MASPTGEKVVTYGELTDVHSSLKSTMRLGDVVRDDAGNEYILLKGVTNTTAKSFVVYDENYETALLSSTTKGAVAIALAATVADKYGWYQIRGKATGLVATGFADNGIIYGTATPGTVDDAVVDGALVTGATGRSAISSGAATIQLMYPYQDGHLDVLT